MPRLKVFQAHLGFFDTIVAAPSQKAALQAWGSRQDLFRDGTAAIATDPDATKAALEKPGVVLKQLSGSTTAFVEHPPLPGSTGPRHKRAAAQRRTRTIQKTQDRSKLEAAKRALAGLRTEGEQMRAEFVRREDALRKEQRSRERELEMRENMLEKQIAAEKAKFGER